MPITPQDGPATGVPDDPKEGQKRTGGAMTPKNTPRHRVTIFVVLIGVIGVIVVVALGIVLYAARSPSLQTPSVPHSSASLPLASPTSSEETVTNARYVDCARPGDEGAGTSPDSAWKTLAKAAAVQYGPGEKLLLKRGCRWEESLAFTARGSAWGPDTEVRLGAYGSGNRPMLSIPEGTSLQLADPDFTIVEDLELFDEKSATVLLSVYYGTTGHQGLKLRNLTLHGGHLNTAPWKNTSIWINGDPKIVPACGQAQASACPFVARDIELANIETFHTDPPGIDLAGVDFEKGGFPWAAQDVVVRDSTFRDSTGSLSLQHVTNALVMNNRLKGLGNVDVESGTTSIFARYLRNARFFNNVMSDVPAKATYPNNDETGMDFPPGNSGVRVMGNFFGRNAGAGFNFDPVPPAKAGSTGFAEVEQNVFKSNGLNPDRTKTSRGSVLVGAFDNNNYQLKARVRNNLSHDAKGFLVYHPAASSPYARKTYIDCAGCLVVQDNPVVNNDNRLFHAGDDFAVGPTASGAWRYETSTDGTTWRPLAADAASDRYGNESTGFVGRFSMRPASCAGCVVARVWTAPAGMSGRVAVAGWFFRLGVGGGDLEVTVTGPGGVKRQWKNMAAGPQDGQASWIPDSDGMTVAPGDQIRFEVRNPGGKDPGALSWAPGLAVLE